jgi:hypothetical protein
MHPLLTVLLVAAAALGTACRESSEPIGPVPRDGTATFSQDLAFLSAHTRVEVLADPVSGAKVALAPAWQGRVLTSTAGGEDDASYGWIHYANIEAGILPEAQRQGLQRHIHVFGGEERLWLGPEGGQFALFFPKGVPYQFEHWQTPSLLDTEPFELVGRSETSIRFARTATITNRAGTGFRIRLERAVQILNKAAIAQLLEVPVPTDLATVGYRSTNTLTNVGDQPWTRESGLISLWMLGMFKHGPAVTMVIPLADGPGEPLRADYFGSPGKDRLRVTNKTVFFKGDGAFRSKIGIPPVRSTGIAGSWDPQRGVLTILRCDRPANAADLPWVRSQWRDHANPYDGEQLHAYNDGPPEPGSNPLGPFYELETSSPALPLAPNASLTHVADTIHFAASPEVLSPIAEAALGVTLKEIETAFTNTP